MTARNIPARNVAEPALDHLAELIRRNVARRGEYGVVRSVVRREPGADIILRHPLYMAEILTYHRITVGMFQVAQ